MSSGSDSRRRLTDATSPFRVCQKSCDLDDMGDFWTVGEFGQDVAMLYMYEDGLKNSVLLLILILILILLLLLLLLLRVATSSSGGEKKNRRPHRRKEGV